MSEDNEKEDKEFQIKTGEDKDKKQKCERIMNFNLH